MDSELHTFLQEVNQLAVDFPQIRVGIHEDLDLHGQKEKALRVADAQWIEAQNDRLPGIECVPITAPAAQDFASEMPLVLARTRAASA